MTAYRTVALGVESIVLCDTRAQARRITVLAARDAGFACSFTDVAARRAPEYDDASVPRNRCFAVWFVEAEQP